MATLVPFIKRSSFAVGNVANITYATREGTLTAGLDNFIRQNCHNSC